MASASSQLQLSDLTVIDVDSHIDEDVEDLLPYVESSGATRTLESADLRREVFTDTRPTPPFPTTDSLVDKGDLENPDLVHVRGADPAAKQEFMQRYDIDYSLLTTAMFGFAGINNDVVAVELAKAFNRWVTAEYLPTFDMDRVKATLLVPNQRPNAAAEIIDQWGDEECFAGVQLPAAGLVPPAGHHWYDPIYEAAERHDLPVCMHSGSATGMFSFPLQQRWARTFTESHALIFPIESMWHLNSLIFRGAPERFPDLNWVIVESGVEWVPWMTWRMDDHYLQNSQDVPVLDRPPSSYIDEQFYFTTMPLGHTDAAHHQATMIDAAGAESSILFASDHPHPDLDLPDELFGTLSRNLDEDATRAVMGESAAELFDF
ncbi:MAG: amidohydrolase family protein [Salinirussus sp.]